MLSDDDLYRLPSAASPRKPSHIPHALANLAVDVASAAERLAGALHPITARAIADFLRPANSYYSNLIEGHDTHPMEIARALRADYDTTDKHKRDLQQEAVAHIEVHKRLPKLLAATGNNPYSAVFWRSLHREFYAHMPEEFRWVELVGGRRAEVLPGEVRTLEVTVGHHAAPAADALPAFLQYLEDGYNPTYEHSRLMRITTIAAAHHRLAWVHPFLDGNGRVIRLFSDAAFMAEGLDAGGLWSMSRGLARHEKHYKQALAAADARRGGSTDDGRGNLSENRLIEFCEFFLNVALDQIRYMTSALALDEMRGRIRRLTDLMVKKGKWRRESCFILEDAFLKGSLSRGEVVRLSGLSDKPAKDLAENLVAAGLLVVGKDTRFPPYLPAYPIAYAPVLFPGLYPAGKEAGLEQA